MSINCRNRGFPQTVWAVIGKLFNRNTDMTVLLCEHDEDDDDDDDHDTTRFRAVRRRNVTTPTMTEINSDESLYRFMANKGAKSQKTRKCTAACVRTNKGDRYTGAADTAATSLCCNDTVQKTYRPSTQQRDRSTSCTKNATDCRGQCPRTGKYVANDKTQCTGPRSHRANEGQCTVAASKYGATDNSQCTGTRSHRANEGQCTSATAKYVANDNSQFTGTQNYRSNDGQYTGASTWNYDANNNRCTDIGNYRAHECQNVGTGNYGANSSGCNGCGCIPAVAAAAVAAAACLGGANGFGSNNPDTLVSTVYKWAKVAKDWTWDKSSYFLVAVVSFILGIYTCDLGLCTCEEVSS
ncbi:unnamed protein product [Macrosiphum euphorbiae]|uniref:Uncharacterized protein n=1 Tax=Macrosiphum euphorbiae TaxID=13131 RepID=A0AAV0WTW6_9HEMI|nr:unnamed protein product [Macrosiphum euphorbiae]